MLDTKDDKIGCLLQCGVIVLGFLVVVFREDMRSFLSIPILSENTDLFGKAGSIFAIVVGLIFFILIIGQVYYLIADYRSGKKEFEKSESNKPQVKHSEGIRRIVSLISILFAFAWIVFVADKTDGFSRLVAKGWILFVTGTLVAYFTPKVVCKAIYWVIDGFKKDKQTE